MKLGFAWFLFMSGMVLANPPQTKQQCIADCKAKCTSTKNSCIQKAKSKAAVESCERSAGICSSQCSDKVCSGYSDAPKK